MNVNCIIDDLSIAAELNSHMPLSELIRQRRMGKEGVFCACQDKKCMNCLCFLEDIRLTDACDLLPACLVPAFRINGRKVTTCGYFMESEDAQDIIDAYSLLGVSPCSSCYEQKTMIFSHIVRQMLSADLVLPSYGGSTGVAKKTIDWPILANMRLSACACIPLDACASIVDAGAKIRRNRLV